MNSAVLQLFVCSTRAKKCAGTSTTGTLLYKLVDASGQAASAAEIIRLEASVSGSLREARLSLPAVRSGRLSRRVHARGRRPGRRVAGAASESPPEMRCVAARPPSGVRRPCVTGVRRVVRSAGRPGWVGDRMKDHALIALSTLREIIHECQLTSRRAHAAAAHWHSLGW